MIKGVWNKLLTHRSDTPFEADITEKVNKIVDLGQTLGIDDIDAETVVASLSVQAEALTDEDLVDLYEELNPNDDFTTDDFIPEEEETDKTDINKEQLMKIIQCLDEATDLGCEFDSNYQRSHTFKNILKEASIPYRELLKQKTDLSMKQKEISQFYEKILPESPACNENRITTTPSTSSQMKEKNLPKKNQIMQNFLDKRVSKTT